MPPPKEPRIIGMAQTYKVGNIVEVTCKSKDSKPAPRIQWLVNKENVSKEWLVMHRWDFFKISATRKIQQNA